MWLDKITQPNKTLGENDEIMDWTKPSKIDFLLKNHENNKENFNYKKQLIIQLQGDNTSFEAAQALFSKHPKQSEWLQLKDGKIGEVLTWSDKKQDFVYTSPLKLDADGNIRITLVGHGKVVDGITTFGGMSAETIKTQLNSLFSNDIPHIKGIKLNLVGCALLDTNLAIKDTLPGQLAEWLKTQAEHLGLSAEQWSVVARPDLIKVTTDGNKEVLIDGKWINKEVAELNGQVHKVVLVEDASGQLIKQPLTQKELGQATATLITLKKIAR